MPEIQGMDLQGLVDMFSDRAHDFEPELHDYKLMFWDGKERVPLVVEAVDHKIKTIVFGDVRRFQLNIEVNTTNFENALKAELFDMQFDQAYWADVLFEGAPTP